MLKKSVALNFIRKLDEHIECNVNIMDDNGIIIASRDKNRIGTFHEAAYRLIRENEKIERIEMSQELPLGVKPGINLPIKFEGKTIGVVGLTGDPDRILDLSYSIKTSVETLIELELYKESVLKTRDKNRLFMNYLLSDEPYDQIMTEKLAGVLDYKINITRVPVMVPLEKTDIELNDALNRLHKVGYPKLQDILFVTTESSLLLFIAVSLEDEQILEKYRTTMSSIASELQNIFRKNGASPHPQIFIGPPQNRLEYYRTGYRQVQWLETRVNGKNEEVHFFLDHAQDYFLSRIPLEELISCFRAFYSLISPQLRNTLFRTITILSETNLNIKEAASRLGVHRNTITGRLARLKDILGIDIIGDPRGKNFIFLIMAFDHLLINS